jgi:hypothetical protein
MPSKYAPLAAFLAAQPPETITVTLTCAEIETLIGAPLPRAAGDPTWWGNMADGRAQAQAWLSTGWRTTRVMLGTGIPTITFARMG